MGESAHRQYSLAVFCIILPSVFTFLRFLARQKTKAKLLIDDWSIIFALAACIATAALLIIDTAKGRLGRPLQRDAAGSVVWDLGSYSTHQKALYGSLLTQVLSIGPTKVSVLFFYRRIFSKNGTRWFNITSLIMIYIVVGWTISFFFVNLFECGLDIDQLWMMKPTASRQCVRQFKMCQSQAYSAVATDILIIILPIPIIWKLSWDLKRKMGLSCVFLLGALTTAASIARAIVQNGVVKRRERHDDELQYYLAPIVYWPLIESAIGIVAACLPLLLPLVRGFSMESLRQSLMRTISKGFSRHRSHEVDEDDDSALEVKSESLSCPQLRDESGWLKAYQDPALVETIKSEEPV